MKSKLEVPLTGVIFATTLLVNIYTDHSCNHSSNSLRSQFPRAFPITCGVRTNLNEVTQECIKLLICHRFITQDWFLNMVNGIVQTGLILGHQYIAIPIIDALLFVCSFCFHCWSGVKRVQWPVEDFICCLVYHNGFETCTQVFSTYQGVYAHIEVSEFSRLEVILQFPTSYE
ncbi:hypothetical protein B0J14DRAFT_592695 [Halenospora varia]|nr:hypothetical protein B0J14DRAFT_592695 [Halenospora varia]